jgi:hypothetical protein
VTEGNIIGWTLYWLGCAVVGGAAGAWLFDHFKKKKDKREDFQDFLDRIKREGEEKLKEYNLDTKETSELYLRDKAGKMFEVKIVVDEALDGDNFDTPDEFNEKVSIGEAGRLKDLMTDGQNAKVDSRIGDCKEFVFSKKSVDDMRKVGLQPEDIVVKMLRAAGRIA